MSATSRFTHSQAAPEENAPPVQRSGTPMPRPQPTRLDESQTKPGALAERRHELAAELAELQWDLGGLTYEMAIRDHFRLDVLVKRAARLQQVDAELGEVERLLRLDQAAASGACPSCGALHSRGAVFCWQCGHQLLDQSAPDPAR